MSTIKSSSEHLTLNADGSSKDIKFQANGVEKASISSAGAFTSTTIDATKLTGNLPAISGASLTGFTDAQMPAGSVLQVITAETSTRVILATTTYTDIGLSAAITPSSSSSKILVFWTQHCRANVATAGTGSKLLRGSTAIWTTGTAFYTYAASGASHRDATDFRYLDSPNTTSAVTYKVQAASNDSVNVSFSDNNNQSTILLMEIAG